MKPYCFAAIATGIALFAAGNAHAQQLRTFGNPNYSGEQRVFRDPQPDLQVSRPTKIGSVRLETEKWLICAGANFTGDCLWVSRDVPSLADLGFSDRPGSLKPERVPIVMRHWGNRRPAARTDLVLFEKANYDGNWVALKDDTNDFAAAQLKSPGSVVLGDGVWRLCTGVDYSGRCLVTTGSAWDLGEIFPGSILSAKKLQ